MKASMTMRGHLWASVLVLLVGVTRSTLVIDIDVDHVVQTVDERFLSVTLDQSCLALRPKFGAFDFGSARLRTLLRGLSPAYFRFGGTSADYTVFSEADPDEFLTTGTKPVMYTMSKEDWDNFVNFTRDTGTRFLFEFSLQLRYGTQWDPSNAIELLNYLTAKGYGDNIDFELGNEPNDYALYPDWAVLSGDRIVKDYNILKKVLAKYPAFNRSILVGPDTGDVDDIYNTFVKENGQHISAATWHHYYFAGPGKNYSEYLNVSHFDTLRHQINASLAPVKAGPNPSLPVWLGETSDSYSGGTLNVTDRFVSGFLWLDKLGLSASMGLKAVLRQTFFGHNYPLVGNDTFPNPDYWLSYLYKKLVGSQVLTASLEDETLRFPGPSQVPATLRVYAHCTRPSDTYQAGAVTIYALNVDDASVSFHTTGPFSAQPIDQYLLTAGVPDGMLSRSSLLNGQLLAMVDEHTLPDMAPVHVSPGKPITLSPLSYGYFVLPQANVSVCA